MDFAFSAEQDMLRQAAREFLTEQHPLDSVAAVADSEPGWQPESWKQLADMGWTDSDLDLLDHVVLFEETGAALLPGPLFSTIALAFPANTGELRLSLAWAESGRSQEISRTDLSTTVDSAGLVTGQKVLVPDAAFTDSLLVTVSGGGLRLVRTSDAVVTPVSTSDQTRRLYTVEFSGAPSTEVSGNLVSLEQRAFVLAAAEALGVGRRALEDGIAHASTRTQFGKVIGTYQAVSHQLVDAYAALELARSLTYWAAWTVSEDASEAPVACAAALKAASDAAVTACENAIQVLGGVGMTWEHALHRLYKRAQWLQAFGGRSLRGRIADAIFAD